METIGVKIVAEGASQATKQLDSFNKSLGNLQKQAGATSKVKLDLPTPKTDWLKTFSPLIERAQSKLTSLSPAVAGASKEISALASAGGATIPVLAGLTAAVAASVVAWGAFFKLGARGASLQPTIQAFGNINSAAGDSTKILNDLRTQTRGNISDFELMRLSVASLQGTSADFRKTVAPDLGTIIDLTGRVAQASGQSADVVREKFLLGLRRQSKLLLDDVGVAVDAEKAYKAYADSIGVATGALTEQQKQAAYAAEAIRQLKVTGEEIGAPATVMENLGAPLVVVTNLLDKLALAIQPAFAPFAQLLADVSFGFQSVANLAFPIIQSLATLFGTVFTGALNLAKGAFNFLFGDMMSFASEAAPYVVAAITLLIDAFNGLLIAASSLATSLGAVLAPVRGVVSKVFGGIQSDTNVTISALVYAMSSGGTKIIASFAAGLLNGASNVVAAVTTIAKIVADFLEGFSPPKEGPLSNIDVGGENVAKAWADGFAKGMLDPIEQVTKQVDEALGAIGKLSYEQVQARIGQLDKALIPFQNRLDIVKGSFEQIAGFADPAIKILEKQLQKAIQAKDFAKAQELDKQLGNLTKLKNAEQERLDNAELQLALAKSQQAQERALLGIQSQRAKVTEKIAETVQQSGGAGAVAKEEKAKEEKAKKGSGEAPIAESAAAPLTGGKAPDILTPESVKNARDEIVSTFYNGVAQGLQESGFNESLTDFSANTGALQTELGRIAAANPAKKISEKFDQLPTLITDKFKLAKDEATTVFNGFVDGVIGSFGENPAQTIADTFNGFPDLIGGVFEGGKDKAITAIATLSDTLSTNFATIRDILNMNFKLPLTTTFNSLFGPESPLVSTVSGFFAEDGLLMSSFNSLTDTFTTWLDTINPLVDSFTDKIKTIPDSFSNLPTLIGNALNLVVARLQSFASGGLGLNALAGTLNDKLVGVFQAAAQSAVNALENAINSVVSPFLGIPGVGAAIRELGFPVDFGEVFGHAKGGLGVRGMALVGEQGPELINFGKPTNIFPAPLSRTIMDTLAQPQGVAMSNSGGGNTYNNSRTQNNTMNFNVGSSQQALLMQRQQEAYLGM